MKKVLCFGGWMLAASLCRAIELPVPGEGWRKVDVTVEAKSLAASFAENPELEILPDARELPKFRLELRDGNGGVLKNAPGVFRNLVWSSDFRRFVRRLWVPPTASRVVVTAGKDCEIRGATARESTEPGLAVNGDLALGPSNYSGWRRFDRHVLVGRGEGGRGLLNTCPDGCVSSEPMPVTPGKPLTLSVVWANPSRKRLRVSVGFATADGKGCGGFVWNAPKPSGTYDFSAPDGAATMTVSFYEGRIERWSLL